MTYGGQAKCPLCGHTDGAHVLGCLGTTGKLTLNDHAAVFVQTPTDDDYNGEYCPVHGRQKAAACTAMFCVDGIDRNINYCLTCRAKLLSVEKYIALLEAKVAHYEAAQKGSG